MFTSVSFEFNKIYQCVFELPFQTDLSTQYKVMEDTSSLQFRGCIKEKKVNSSQSEDLHDIV